MLNPAWFGVDLLVFLLIETNDLTTVVEDHEAGAGGSLIDGCCILSHVRILLWIAEK
jgi:hypothetical protein